MRALPFVLAASLVAPWCPPVQAAGIAWHDGPDPKDTYVPHRKELVLEDAATLTVRVRTNRHPDNRFLLGDKVRAIVATSADARVYLVGIDEAWDVAQVFPGNQFKDNQLTAGREQTIPPERGARVGYYTPDRAGTQYLIAVASLAPLDLAPLLPSLRGPRGDFAAALAAFRRGLDAARPGCAVDSCRMTIGGAGKVVAVVIGCGAYARSPLGSTVPDAQAFAGYLKETFGAKLSLRLLCDPGRAQIVDALSGWLPEQVEPGDSIFFYYSGHGTNVKDLDGDEADGLDEALVPVDYAPVPAGDWAGARARLIVDDDLHRWLKNAADRGAAKTILVFDACHSGTAHRGLTSGPVVAAGGMVPKVFPDLWLPTRSGERPFEPPRAVARGLTGTTKRGLAPAGDDPGWGVIAACKDNEISWAGERLSLMTTHLIEGLTKKDGHYPCDANRDGRVTLKEAADYARDRVRAFVDDNSERLRKCAATGDPTQTVTTLPSGESLTINGLEGRP